VEPGDTEPVFIHFWGGGGGQAMARDKKRGLQMRARGNCRGKKIIGLDKETSSTTNIQRPWSSTLYNNEALWPRRHGTSR